MTKEERYMTDLLKKFNSEPLAKERQEFGRFLLRNIDTLTPSERERYDELKEILKSNYRK
jgi:hypothetical protein